MRRNTATATARDVHRDALSRAWLLHFLDREPLEVWASPPATHGEALALYPEAIAAVPIPDRTSTRAASTSERADLLALISAIYRKAREAPPFRAGRDRAAREACHG